MSDWNTEGATKGAAQLEEVLARGQAAMRELRNNVDGQNAAIKDISARIQALQESANAPRERAPSGESLSKFVGTKGMRLRSETSVRNFAGHTVKIAEPGLFDGAPVDEWHRDLLRLSSARYLARRILARDNRALAETPQIDGWILEHLAAAPAYARPAVEKAVSDTASSGAEWIPDIYSGTLYEEFYTPAGIAALFPTVEMRGGGLIVPTISDTIRPYNKGKISQDDPSKYTASTPGSSSTTIEPAGFAARVLVDDAAAEDAIFALLPEITARVGRAITDGYEDCMVNGDTAATHQDAIASWNIRSRWGSSNLGGAADHRRSFIGFRPLADDRSLTVNQSSGMTIAKVMEELIGGLGERAGSDVVILVSPEVLFKKMLTDTNVLTVDKLGMNATILRGQLAQVFGVPIVMTRWIDSKLNTSGKYDNSTMTKSGVIAVSRNEFAHYQRRGQTVEMDRDITIGGYNLVATLRRKMATLSSSSSAVVKFGYGWTGES